MPNLYYRAFYALPGARGQFEAGGPFYIPRDYQGGGRHDLGDEGILYCSLAPLSAVVEALKPFRNQSLGPADLAKRDGAKLALAQFRCPGENLADLRKLTKLSELKISPANLASSDRQVTQAIAKKVYAAGADGLVWVSALDAQWSNASLFSSRVRNKLKLVNEVTELSLTQPLVLEAADYLNISYE
jgi:hypothetical protein